jgi:hypothetical protein
MADSWGIRRQRFGADVLLKLRWGVERLEFRYFDLLIDVTEGREADQAPMERSDELRRAREAIEEARRAIDICERVLNE